MKELILRLIKDNKIVGYQVHRDGGIYFISQFWQVTSFIIDKVQTFLNNIDYIPHDSFDLGVYIEDKIVFEGDIVEYLGCQHTVIHTQLDWFMKDEGGALMVIKLTNYDEIKIIGNVYEK